MAIIKAPNEGYTGVSASVAFCNGEGRTDNKNLIQWFKDHGYTVIEGTPDPPETGGDKKGKSRVKNTKVDPKEEKAESKEVKPEETTDLPEAEGN